MIKLKRVLALKLWEIRETSGGYDIVIRIRIKKNRPGIEQSQSQQSSVGSQEGPSPV